MSEKKKEKDYTLYSERFIPLHLNITRQVTNTPSNPISAKERKKIIKNLSEKENANGKD